MSGKKTAIVNRASLKGQTMNGKIYITTAILTSIAFAFISVSVASDSQEENGISYVIDIDEKNQNIARVTATFVPVDNRLYMFPGADDFPERWAKFINHVSVVDENNQPIEVTAMEDANWSLATTPDKPVRLSYQLNLDHENAK